MGRYRTEERTDDDEQSEWKFVTIWVLDGREYVGRRPDTMRCDPTRHDASKDELHYCKEEMKSTPHTKWRDLRTHSGIQNT